MAVGDALEGLEEVFGVLLAGSDDLVADGGLDVVAADFAVVPEVIDLVGERLIGFGDGRFGCRGSGGFGGCRRAGGRRGGGVGGGLGRRRSSGGG